MGDKRNFAALDWVIGEIAETLKEARQSLEAYVEDPKDSTRIRFCLTHIHQVHGSLQMVEFHGAALLAEEMEHTAQAIMENTVASIPEAQEVLMRSLLQLPIYLEHARSAKEDNPARIMPLLNDMRAVRKQSYLSETNLFSPDLSAVGVLSGNKHPVLQSREKLLPVLKKLREMYQYAAASVLRGIKVEENLSYIEKVFSRLEILSAGTRSAPLWEVSAALIDALKRDDVELTVAVKGLLRFIAKELRILGENAPGAMDLPPREGLLKNLLYYVGRADDGSEKVANVKKKYGLSKAASGTSGANEQGLDDMLQTPDADAIRSVVAALQDEIGTIKHSLDLSLSGQHSASELKEILPAAKRIADTLAVLGIGDLRKKMLDQATSLEAMSATNKIDEEQLVATANRIAEIEQRLKAIGASAGKHTDLSQINEREVEIDAAKMAVINECVAGLQKCKEAIVDYISSQWDKQHLAGVDTLLADIRGGLGMIPLPRAAAVVNSCASFVQEKLVNGLGHPNFEQLELLADAVASVEYYLERLTANLSEDAESTLDMAEESVAKLGYPSAATATAPQAQSADAEPDSSRAPDGSPLVSVTSPSNFISDPTDFLGTDSSEQTEEDQSTPFDDVPSITTTEDFSDVPHSRFIEDSDTTESEADDAIALSKHVVAEEDEPPVAKIVEEHLSDEPEPQAESSDEITELAVYEEDEVQAAPAVEEKPLPPLKAPAVASKKEETESDIDDEIIEIFIEEANEVLETLAEYFPKWKAKESDQDALVIVRRAFHTLKGSGRMVEAFDIGELAWSIENMLNRVIDHTISVKPQVFHIAEAVMDIVPYLIKAFEERAANPVKDATDQYMTWAHDIAEGRFPRELAEPLPPYSVSESSSLVAQEDVAAQPDTDNEEATPTAESELTMAESEAESGPSADSSEALTEESADDDELDLVTHQDYYTAKAASPEVEIKTPEQISADEDLEEDKVLQEIFSQEAVTHLATVEKFIRDMEEEAPIYAMPSDELQRALHTLKGSAKMAQVWPIAEITEPLEHFAKELISYQIRVDEDILQLIRDAAEYTRYGIEQIGKGKPVVIEKTPQFVARTEELRDRYVGHLALPNDEQTGAFKVDPRMLAIVMAEEMVRLLEADRHLNQWEQDGFCDSEIGRLLDELKVLEEGARQANLPEMASLTASLRAAHKLALANNLLADSAFFRLMHKGHDALLDMVDVVAAGQNVQAIPQEIARGLAEFLARDLDEGSPLLQEEEVVALPLSEMSNDKQDILNAGASFVDEHLSEEEYIDESSDDEIDSFFTSSAGKSSSIDFANEEAEDAITFELPIDDEGEDGELLIDLDDDSEEIDFSAFADESDAGDESEIVTLADEDKADYADEDFPFLALDEEDEEITELTDVVEPGDVAANGHDLAAHDSLDLPHVDETQTEASAPEKDQHDSLYQEHSDDAVADMTKENPNFGQSRSIMDEAQEEASIPEYQDSSAQDETASSQVSPGPTIPGLLDVIDSASADFDRDILEIFLEEADELIESMDEAIHSWEKNWADTDGVEEIKRVLHTLKGGARLSGLMNLGDLVHDYETMIIEKGDDPALVNAALFGSIHQYQDKMLSAIKGIKTFVEGDYEVAYPAPSKASPTREKAAAAKIETPLADGLASTPTGAAASESSDEEHHVYDDSENDDEEDTAQTNIVRFEPKSKERNGLPETGLTPEFAMPSVTGGGGGGNAYAAVAQALKKAQPQEVVKVSAELLEELVNLAGETSINRSRLEQYVNDFGFALDEVDSTLSRLQDQLRRLDMETEAQVLFRQEQMEASDQFDPLEMDRYSHLQQLSRSLIESASDLMDLKSQLGDKLKTTETLLLQQSRINTTLQEGLMRSRMVPFSRLVPRLRRIVRQVATELGKNVSFELDNVEGELDRSVLERMVPPFEHMLRNAVDHGIEMPEDRIAAGKSEAGRIVLTLAREGGDVLIRLADDGRGVDLKRVRAKAIERGLMSPDAELSDHDIMQFILHAGFSTAESVTQISGRGVGMDVVHAEIKQLGGSVMINSAWGKGTEFIIRLPFTLSVNRALMVLIGNDHYAVPLSSIEGIVRVSPFELEHYYAHPEAKFEYARETYDVRYLGALLYRDAVPSLAGQVLPLPVLLVRSAEHAMALQVDAVMGSREIVVKSLGVQFSAVTGLSGATVMGDGSVVVILDPHALVRQEIARANLQLEGKAPVRQIEEHREEARAKHIMVVDDSVTVRKVTTRFLEREGFEVSTAKDGMDALRLLQEITPDLMLLDIEMPRMDGFEVARTVRSTKRWEDIPIIMITSRTGDKHREHAMSLGVNNYLGKPYQEDILLEAIGEILEPNFRQV